MTWPTAVLLALASLVAFASGLLVVRKSIQQTRARRFVRRKTRYLQLVAELAVVDTSPVLNRGLADDSLFREVLLDYLRMLRGAERSRLLAVARQLGIVDHFQQETNSGRKGIRARAVEALSEIADPATVGSLVLLLHDPQHEVRVQAAAALAAIGDPRVLPSLLVALDNADEWAAMRMADALLRFESKAVASLAAYITGAGRFRPLVARTLGLIGDPAAEPALIQVLDSPDTELRVRAAAALGRCGSAASVGYLVQLLHDPAWEVRSQAAVALGRRTEPAAIPALASALSDSAWWVRHNAAAALSQIPGGADALRFALTDDDRFGRDAAAAVLLTVGTAEQAARDLAAEDPLDRQAARDLVTYLLEAGKAEYFRALGVEEQELRRLGLHER